MYSSLLRRHLRRIRAENMKLSSIYWNKMSLKLYYRCHIGWRSWRYLLLSRKSLNIKIVYDKKMNFVFNFLSITSNKTAIYYRRIGDHLNFKLCIIFPPEKTSLSFYLSQFFVLNFLSVFNKLSKYFMLHLSGVFSFVSLNWLNSFWDYWCIFQI